MNRLMLLLMFAVVISSLACSKSDLRGEFKPSADGNTYLAVIDDNGGHCGPIRLDGKTWAHPIGEMGRVDAGHHTISCGGDIEFDIPRGVVYKFTYWGP